jgi:oligoendopeptidase F
LSDSSLERIPPYRARRFVPPDFDTCDAAQASSLYTALAGRVITSAEELERFLADRSELETALAHRKVILYIEMTCHTDDPDKAGRYKNFIETVQAAVKLLADRLDRKYLQERARFALDARRYEVYDRDTKADVELFRDENVPLQTKDDLLAQDYQTLYGAMMVSFEGREYTLDQMWKFLEEPDRPRRESAWRAAAERRLRDQDRADEIFDAMIAVRTQIAKNAGFANYRDFKFREYHRFDYTPQSCRQFHEAVEKRVVPVLADLYRKRKTQMGLASLRPWDLEADPQGRPPLKPFETIEEYVGRARKIFGRLDPQLGGQFQEMIDLGLLDLASRRGKAPGGYQEVLWEARKPFIFGNVVGSDNDLRLILHEGGHAFHSYACADQPLLHYHHPPIEFCEVASMSMELFASFHLDLFYNASDVRRSRRIHLEQIVRLLTWVAVIDAYQHWLYEHQGHSRDQRRGAWLEIHQRFGGGLIDWTGLDRQRAALWQRQLHLFIAPLYYIEYGIAQLGALGLWLEARKDLPSALGRYRRALALGGSRPLPELFAAAGLEFDFSEKTLGPLIEAVQDELSKLG